MALYLFTDKNLNPIEIRDFENGEYERAVEKAIEHKKLLGKDVVIWLKVSCEENPNLKLIVPKK